MEKKLIPVGPVVLPLSAWSTLEENDMDNRELANKCIAGLQSLGAEKSAVMINDGEVRELCCRNGEISMLRSTYNVQIGLTAIKDNKKSVVSVNKADEAAIESAMQEALVLAASSNPDTAHDISEFQPVEEFQSGIMDSDTDKMYDRMKELLEGVRAAYPKTYVRDGSISFHKNRRILKNSNGVDYSAVTGYYEFFVIIISKDGGKVSSFNYVFSLMKDIDEPLIACANLRQVLKQSGEEINARAFDQKFTGDVIITPECMESMINPVLNHLRDHAHITGYSLFKDKLGQKIASDMVTLRSNPIADDFAVKSFFSEDGFKNENVNIIDKGVLNSHLLTLYGANKTGLERARTDGTNISIDPGTTKLADIIKNTEKGLLLSRFSGGMPNDNGDFSGIAKNSYFIENGEIKYPVKEIMVTGNIIEMMRNIVEISEETIDFGCMNFPWMKVSGFTISGK